MSQTAPQKKLFILKVVGGQEKNVARLMANRVELKKAQGGDADIQAILALDEIKGYLLIEGNSVQAVLSTAQGLKHVRGLAAGTIPLKDVEHYFIQRPLAELLERGDLVEIVAGPFRGMTARVERVDPSRSEAVVVLVGSEAREIPVTLSLSYLKQLPKEKAAGA
ncbi:MAG: transcription elongation factor Spt5 [Nitrososphaerota archaeon]